MNPITINQADFLKGMSLTDYYNNGGFSPKSLGFEVDRGANLGILLPGRGLTDYTTGASGDTLSGNVLAAVTYYLAGTGAVYYLGTSTGKIYQSTLAPVHTLKDTIPGVSVDNIGIYKNGLYVILPTDIYFDDLTFTIKDKTWWTVTKGKPALTAGVPHKRFEFNGVMYVTNGNKLISWDGATVNDSAFVLPEGWVITDAIADEDTILICASYSSNNPAFNPLTKIFVWNSFVSTQWQRELTLSTSAIDTIIKANGNIYFFAYGNFYLLNKYTGETTLIRKFSISPNYNQIYCLNEFIYFATLNGVGCYNTKFNIFTVPVCYGGTISALIVAYLDYIDIFNTSGNMYRCISNNSLNAPSPTFYSNWYDLNNALIKKIIICFSSELPTNATFTLDIYDETGVSRFNKIISRAIHGDVSVVCLNNLSMNYPINLLQLKLLSGNTANPGIRFIKIFLQPYQSEKYVNR